MMTTPYGQPPLGEITPTLVESMMNRMIVMPALFQEVSGILEARHFYKPEEQHFAVLWDAMQAVFTRYQTFDYTTLRTKVEELLCERPLPDALRWQLLAEPDGILDWTMHNPELVRQVRLDQSREIVRRFLKERLVYAQLAQVWQAGVPADMGTVLANATTALQRVEQVNNNPTAPAVLGLWQDAPVNSRTTGLGWLDRYMDGGHANGEVIGLLGPTGVGKTLLGCNLAVASAQTEFKRAGEEGRRPRCVYFITYELRRMEVLGRILANHAQIAASTCKLLDGMNHWNVFSSATRNDYKPYEHSLPLRSDGPRLGEAERYMNAERLLKDTVHIMDLSGNATERSRVGDGGIKELTGLIAQDQAVRGNPGVELVVIDYLMVLVTRSLQRRGLDLSKNLRLEIPTAMDEAKGQIAQRFNTPVWMLHQLNAAGNRKGVTATNNHIDAAESSSFAHNCAFVASLGTKDVESSCALLTFGKRRRAGDYVPPVIVHIDGQFATMRDGGEDFVLAPTQNRILPRRLAQQFMGAATPRATTSAAYGVAAGV